MTNKKSIRIEPNLRPLSPAEAIELDRWQVEEIEKAIGEAGRGEFATSKQVRRVMKQLNRSPVRS